MPQPITQGPEGERMVEYLGTRVVLRVRSEQSGGRFSTVEVWSPKGPAFGPPLHIDAHDEHFYVLDGTVTFQTAAGRWRAVAGSSVYVPEGALHTFANLDPEPSRLLVTFSPGQGFERYFEDLAALLKGVAGMTPDVMASVAALGAQYGVEVKGPPIGPA